MAESKPNKKFVYIEDNGDGTCLFNLSVPEHDVFDTAILTFDFDVLFKMVAEDISLDERRKTIMDNVTIIPNFPEE